MTFSANAVNSALNNGRTGGEITNNGNNAASLENQFMTLMIAQIQNQDPTDPLDANEYVAQLATFSQVESLEGMRSDLQTQMAMMENTAIIQSANLVGKNAMIPAEQFQLDASGEQVIDGKVYLNSSAESLTIDIKDSLGQVVHTVNLGTQAAGDVAYSIDAKAYGLEEGEYSLEVNATQGEDALETQNFLSAPIEKIHFISAQGSMMAELGFGLGTVSVLDISEVS